MKTHAPRPFRIITSTRLAPCPLIESNAEAPSRPIFRPPPTTPKPAWPALCRHQRRYAYPLPRLDGCRAGAHHKSLADGHPAARRRRSGHELTGRPARSKPIVDKKPAGAALALGPLHLLSNSTISPSSFTSPTAAAGETLTDPFTQGYCRPRHPRKASSQQLGREPSGVLGSLVPRMRILRGSNQSPAADPGKAQCNPTATYTSFMGGTTRKYISPPCRAAVNLQPRRSKSHHLSAHNFFLVSTRCSLSPHSVCPH
jgi:hypothetical protein